MLEVKSLSVSYGQHRAVENAALKVNRGEIVVILGANGAGKSTLLKAISGICEGRVSGAVAMQGKDILGLAANRIVDEGIALVPEGRGVFGDLTVAENLKLGAHAPRARDEEAGNLDRVLRLFPKLTERKGQIVRTMSGGEQQMVAIGRAMMSNPALLTLDEPSLGLSPLLCKELFQALKAVRNTGIGILLVEQNARQSLAIADRAYLLENGRIVHEGRAEDLRNDPAVQAAYLGGGKSGHGKPGRPASQPAPSSAEAVAPIPAKISGPSPHDIAAAALAGLPSTTIERGPPPHPASASLGHPPGTGHGYRPVLRTPEGRGGSEMSRQLPFSPAGRRWPEGSDEGATGTARPPHPAPSAASMRGTADALLGGLSIGDLVSQASETSRAAYGATRTASPPPTRSSSASVPTPGSPRIPSIEPGTNSQDRLKSVLAEIEEAAARARAWRHDPGRK